MSEYLSRHDQRALMERLLNSRIEKSYREGIVQFACLLGLITNAEVDLLMNIIRQGTQIITLADHIG